MTIGKNAAMIKLDLGGGDRPREGFINVDQCEGADVHADFETIGRLLQLPYSADTVDEVFSSHCFEHIEHFQGLLHEIVRVCKLGAPVEIRVPHWASSTAQFAGHKHALSEKQVEHWEQFKQFWWPGCKKRLSLQRTEYVESEHFEEVRKLFPALNRKQVMRFIQDTCAEIRYFFKVVAND
jgi:ubiquinone/menaquinone biosynthesis C-methylase UbiE